jgi:Iap family predicted aminopeptidase
MIKKLMCPIGTCVVGLGSLAWYLRAWQPISDVACGRLTAPATGEGPLLDRVSADQLERDTRALAAIHPRNGGTRGEIQAREWVATRFREIGLQRVRLEPVVYPRWIGEGAGLTVLALPSAELPCLPLSGSAATPTEGIKATVIDVGAGQNEDYARLAREQAEGRIHLAWGGSLHRRDICLNATRAGAVGVIIAHPDVEPVDFLTGPSYMVEAGTSVVLGRLPTLAVSHPIGSRLRRAAERGNPVRLNVACRYALGRGYNVVGELPGQTREYVALVAHHDAWYQGAADNAAGVAGLLGLAQAWLRPAYQGPLPRRMLRFVSTAAEEEGLMGALSDVVLRGVKIKARCRGLVSLDVVGAPGETLWVTGWPAQLRGAAVAIARDLDYEAVTGNQTDIYEGRAYGDHWPYTLMRIPGVMLAKFPYRYYHTPYDTPDRLDYTDAVYQVTVAGTLAWRLAHL